MSDTIFIFSQLILISALLLLFGIAFGVLGKRRCDSLLMDLGSYLATGGGIFSLMSVLFYLSA